MINFIFFITLFFVPLDLRAEDTKEQDPIEASVENQNEVTKNKPRGMSRAKKRALKKIIFGESQTSRSKPSQQNTQENTQNPSSAPGEELQKQVDARKAAYERSAASNLSNSPSVKKTPKTQSLEKSSKPDNINKFFDNNITPGSSSPTFPKSNSEIAAPSPIRPLPTPTIPPTPFTLPSIPPTPTNTPAVPLPQNPSPISQSPAKPSNKPPQKTEESQSPADKNCLQACIDYAKALKTDSAVASIKKSGSRFTIKAASGHWVRRDAQGIRISSSNKSDVFARSCRHIMSDDVDPRDNTLYNYDFNTKSPSAECQKHFSESAQASRPVDKSSEEFVFSDPNSRSSNAGSTNAPTPKLTKQKKDTVPLFLINKEGKHVRVNGRGLDPVKDEEIAPSEQSACDSACFSLVDAYKNGNLAVSGIVTLGGATSFAIEAKDNFSWSNNTAETNPNIEEHEEFIKQCASKAEISVDSSNSKRLNVNFHSGNPCQKKFKLIASDPTPINSEATAQNTPDPFDAPIGPSSQGTTPQNSTNRTPANGSTATPTNSSPTPHP